MMLEIKSRGYGGVGGEFNDFQERQELASAGMFPLSDLGGVLTMKIHGAFDKPVFYFNRNHFLKKEKTVQPHFHGSDWLGSRVALHEMLQLL